MLLTDRERALEEQDWNRYRCRTQELAQIGHVDMPATAPVEHAVASAAPEMVVPAKRRGRPPRPRCEHGTIADRCVECNEELV